MKPRLCAVNDLSLNNLGFSIELRHACDAAEKSTRFLNYLISNAIAAAPDYKADNTPVTIADYGSQIIILFYLTRMFPMDCFMGEENIRKVFMNNKQDGKNITNLVHSIFPEINIKQIESYENKNHSAEDRIWAIDPLDGTKGFIHNRQFSVAIALIENNNIKVGVLGCPKLYKLNSEKYSDREGYLFFAERGKGAFIKSLNGKTIQKIKVNQFNTIAEIIYTESFDNSHININIHKQIADIINIKKPPLKIDSQIKYSLVASGDVSLYLKIPRPSDYKEYIWDNAAGQLIVEEAGGAVTDLSGNEIYYEKTDKLMKNSGIIASNKIIHNDVVKITSQLFRVME